MTQNDPNSAAKISYEEVENVDIEAMEDMDAGELAIHFRNIACRASVPQLRKALEMDLHAALDDQYKQDLESKFVNRRVAAVQRLRKGRSNFKWILDEDAG